MTEGIGVEDRWVCQSCYTSNGSIWERCSHCGLERGAAVVPAPVAEEPTPTPAPRTTLGGLVRRLWWLPVVGAFMVVGYATSAQRDPAGEIERAGSLPIEQLRVGDCFDVAETEDISEVQARPCTEPHEFELLHIAVWDGPPAYPSLDAMDTFLVDVCEPVFNEYIGRRYEMSEIWISWFYPTSESWESGDRTFQCAVYDPDNAQLTNSLKGSRR